MITLLALFFMPGLEKFLVPHYEIDNCYKMNNTSRPNLIKIIDIKHDSKFYVYSIYFENDKSWSESLENSFNAIESVYNIGVKCP